MNVASLRNYGVAFSDAESHWPKELKAHMARRARTVIFGQLRPVEIGRFLLAFLKAKWRARGVDLSLIRAKGMNNEAFLAQQIEYLTVFSALAEVLGTNRAVEVMKRVMDATAREALLLCMPDPAEVRGLGDPMEVFREYLRAGPEASCKAGCLDMRIGEDRAGVFQFEITWCVWLELARVLGVPEGCLPNCYADDLVFPDYFRSMGIRYHRSQTLACGGSMCDFRFEKMTSRAGSP